MKILADGRSFVQEHTPQLPVFHDKPDPHRPGIVELTDAQMFNAHDA